jgi:hypothetical protein
MGSPYGALDKILETDKLDYKDYNIGGDYQP